MREIKFRAWQKYHKRMLEVRGILFRDGKIVAVSTYTSANVLPQLVTYTDEYKSNFYLTNEEGMCLHLMQFTGLLDKNGKEIYEGDIIKITNSSGYVEVGSIVYNDFQAKFGFLSPDDSIYGLHTNDPSNEIIGNIYQNPELLNK